MPRGTSVAGQGLQRRGILRVIGVAALASHFPGFTRWAYADAHAAREAGVCEFVDFMVAHDPEQQSPMRTGLTWLDNPAQQFHSHSPACPISILTFGLRTSEYLLQNFNQRVHRRA